MVKGKRIFILRKSIYSLQQSQFWPLLCHQTRDSGGDTRDELCQQDRSWDPETSVLF